MSLLSKVSLPPLKAGCYQATLQSYSEETTPAPAVTPGTTGNAHSVKEYIRLNLQLSDRIINDNRFEQGLDIAVSQLREQLASGLETPLTFVDVLEMAKQQQFLIWVSYNTVEENTYRNISYRQPKDWTGVMPTATTTARTVEAEDIPDSPF